MRCPRCGFVQSVAQATCRYCGMMLSLATTPSAQAHERANDRARARTANSVVIPFPGARARDVASDRPVPDPSDDSSTEGRSGPPEWREQLRERVRAIRERRGGEGESARPVAEPAPPPARPEKERRNAIAETVAARTRRHVEPARAPKSGEEAVSPSPRPEAESRSRVPLEREPSTEAPPPRALSPEEELSLEGGGDLAVEMDAAPDFPLRARSEEAHWFAREEPQIAPASLGRRLGAALIDLGVIIFSLIPFVASVELIFGDFSHRFVRLALVGVAVAIGILYETISLSVAGRTVGMAVAGLLALNARTMDVPSAGQAVRHILGSVLGAIPIFFGFFWALFNRERRTFGDLFSGIVVRRVAKSVYESQEVHAPWLYRPLRR